MLKYETARSLTPQAADNQRRLQHSRSRLSAVHASLVGPVWVFPAVQAPGGRDHAHG